MSAKRPGGLFRASNGAGVAAQTRHYAARTQELARQLRAEIWAPDRPVVNGPDLDVDLWRVALQVEARCAAAS